LAVSVQSLLAGSVRAHGGMIDTYHQLCLGGICYLFGVLDCDLFLRMSLFIMTGVAGRLQAIRGYLRDQCLSEELVSQK